CMQFLEFPWTF
nr:immunoglobulin light chain junction region [Macaca mulatta]